MKHSISLFTECYGVVAGVEPDAEARPDVVRPDQTHSCRVAVIPSSGAMPDIASTDAIICCREELAVGVRTADCVPLLLFAPDLRAVAAVHAGWKGSLGGITANTLGILKEMGASMKAVFAAFGPSICPRCYEISAELAADFRAAGFADCFISERNIDLQQVNVRRLEHAGVLPEHIFPSRCCTRETPWLPSWRREPSARRLLSWIRLDAAD